MLDVISGYEPGDPYWAPAPLRAVRRCGRAQPRARCASRSRPTPPPACRCTRTAPRPCGETAELLESLGHTVERGAGAHATRATSRTSSESGRPASRSRCAATATLRGQPLDLDKLEPLTREMVDARGLVQRRGLPRVRSTTCRRWRRVIVAMWSDLDVLLTPTVAQPPLKIGALAPKDGEPAMAVARRTPPEWVPFTPVWNVTGQPAISLPLAPVRRRACRSACSSWGRPRARSCCCRWRRSWRRRGRGPSGGRSWWRHERAARSVGGVDGARRCATARSARSSWSRRTSTAPRSART